MRQKDLILCTVITALSLFGTYAGPAQAAQAAPVKKLLSGTVHIHSTQVAFLISGKFGGGTLKWNGQEHYFSIDGLGVGGMGIQTLDAEGAVYGLTDLSQFSGLYAEVRAGATVGLGKGYYSLENANGVTMDLKFNGKGIALSIGADGMQVSLKR